jgi:predicted XRE-type DNA-binding protein
MSTVKGSGNIFTDLGFGPDEAANLKIRSKLMMALSDYIEAHELTQEQAAEVFGVTQPRVSDLVRGKIDLFSIDTLVKMAAAAGLKVKLDVFADHS